MVAQTASSSPDACGEQQHSEMTTHELTVALQRTATLRMNLRNVRVSSPTLGQETLRLVEVGKSL